MNTTDFLKVSTELYIKDYNYSDGLLRLEVETDDDECINLLIKTEIIALNVPSNKSRAHRTGQIELLKINEVLSTRNGFYVPSDDFPSFMKEKRQNLNLAYGLRETDHEFLISFKGSTILTSAVLASEEGLRIDL